MLKKVVILALTFVVLVSAHAANPAPYEATATATAADKDLRALVTRWAQVAGKKLVWEANGNAAIADADALNFEAALHEASSFEQALTRLNKTLRAVSEVNPAKPAQLRACIFSDAIVIRFIEQPPCGSPL